MCAERVGDCVQRGTERALSGFAGVLSVSLAESSPVVGLDMAALTLVLAAVVLAVDRIEVVPASVCAARIPMVLV